MNFAKKTITLLLILSMMSATACQRKTTPPKEQPMKKPTESFLKYGNTNDTIVELSKVNSSVWVHTSYYEENGALIPSNGLVVVTEKGLVLIDTTRTERQMESLDKLVHESFNSGFKAAIVSDAHPDSMGGASYLIKKHIPISSLEDVAKTAEKKGFIVPDQIMKSDSAVLTIDNTEFELYYPGEGISYDNTVVWLKKEKVLYGGCLTAEVGASSLGNTSEANLKKWPDSIKAIKERYPDIDIVIPGHGQWGNASLLDYTLELLGEKIAK